MVAAPQLGPNTWLKLENLQRTGSFKLRGAVRAVAALTDEERAAGVVVASAGNHGAGMALACAEADVELTVCVPPDAPRAKREKIAAAGAEVLEVGTDYDSAESVARELASSRSAVFISPFDHPEIIAGNGGDLGDEVAKQCDGLARVVAPVGGGGLIAGLGQRLGPAGVEVVGAQPERNCAMHDSLRDGHAHVQYRGASTCAKGCEGAVGAMTYEIARLWVSEVVLVSEAAIAAAVAALYREAGLVAECSGAVAVAAAGMLAPIAGSTVIVVSGGNIDAEELDSILRGDR